MKDEMPYKERIKGYSREELLDIAANIDRDEYPGRYEMVMEELKKRPAPPVATEKKNDPLKDIKTVALCGSILAPFFALLIYVASRLSQDPNGVFLGHLALYTVLPALILVTVPFLSVFLTKRAVWVFALNTGGMLVLEWYLMLMGLCFVVLGNHEESTAITAILLSYSVVHVLLWGFLEWRLSPQFWERSVECGRLDLEKARFYPRILVPPSNAERVSPFRQALVGWGAAVGAVTGVFLSRLVGENMALFIGSLAAFGGALLFCGLAWYTGLGFLVRVLSWEVKNRKQIMIA